MGCKHQRESEQYCERWLIPITEAVCERCKSDPVYKNELIERKIAALEEQEKLYNLLGGDYKKDCPYSGETIIERRRCCGGQDRDVEFVFCRLFERSVDRVACRFCKRRK